MTSALTHTRLTALRRISVTFYDEKDKSEKTVKAALGQSLMEAAHANDVDLEGICHSSQLRQLLAVGLGPSAYLRYRCL